MGRTALRGREPLESNGRPDLHRTTVILRADDLENLKAVARATGTTDTEVIRRSIRLMRELVAWERDQGGEIVLQKRGQRERTKLRFL